MTFGLTDAGFSPKRLADILTELQDAFKSAFRDNVDLSSDGPFGQIIGILADREADLWELAGLIWAASFPNTAGGTALTALLNLVNMRPNPADSTVVTAQLVGDANATILEASTFKTSDTKAVFVTTEEVTLDDEGNGVVECEAQETGPINCLAGTLTVIDPAISGLTSVTNALDGTIGRNLETDAEFRERHTTAVATILSSTNSGIISRILQISGVTEVKEIENVSEFSDSFGRPPYSYELLIRGGDDDEIADAMWTSKPSSVKTFGTTSVEVVDSYGDVHTMSFSRPEEVDLYIKLVLDTANNFPTNGEDQIVNAIVAYGQSLKIGQEVSPFGIQSACADIKGIEEMSVYIDIVANPVATGPYEIDPDQLAVLDSSRIQVIR